MLGIAALNGASNVDRAVTKQWVGDGKWNVPLLLLSAFHLNNKME
jgi:hypothetical protein